MVYSLTSRILVNCRCVHVFFSEAFNSLFPNCTCSTERRQTRFDHLSTKQHSSGVVLQLIKSTSKQYIFLLIVFYSSDAFIISFVLPLLQPPLFYGIEARKSIDTLLACRSDSRGVLHDVITTDGARDYKGALSLIANDV